MSEFTFKDKYNTDDLRALVAVLRGENGCPWDKEQTHSSLRRDFLEEAYEVCETIDENDSDHLREELGDVLMHVFFHAGIEEDAGHYDIDGVADEQCKKLISRHPHVFGDAVAKSAEDVLLGWDELKMKQREQDKMSSAMDGIAKSLPATWRADKILSKAEKTGYIKKDFDVSVRELECNLSALEAGGTDASEIMGNVLFSAMKVCRALKLDPEDILNAAGNRFIEEFKVYEAKENK